MRCKACNEPMGHVPLYIKLKDKMPDGSIRDYQVENEYCYKCTNIGLFPDGTQLGLDRMQEDHDTIQFLLNKASGRIA